jgi:hypothetical protein
LVQEVDDPTDNSALLLKRSLLKHYFDKMKMMLEAPDINHEEAWKLWNTMKTEATPNPADTIEGCSLRKFQLRCIFDAWKWERIFAEEDVPPLHAADDAIIPISSSMILLPDLIAASSNPIPPPPSSSLSPPVNLPKFNLVPLPVDAEWLRYCSQPEKQIKYLNLKDIAKYKGIINTISSLQAALNKNNIPANDDHIRFVNDMFTMEGERLQILLELKGLLCDGLGFPTNYSPFNGGGGGVCSQSRQFAELKNTTFKASIPDLSLYCQRLTLCFNRGERATTTPFTWKTFTDFLKFTNQYLKKYLGLVIVSRDKSRNKLNHLSLRLEEDDPFFLTTFLPTIISK